MTEESQRYNLRTILDWLRTAFTVEKLRGLFSFAKDQDPRPVPSQFAPEDGKPAMVRKAVAYCLPLCLRKRLAEMKDADPTFLLKERRPEFDAANLLSIVSEINAEIEAEQALVDANRELIERFEKKIGSTLARIWGEEEPPTPNWPPG